MALWSSLRHSAGFRTRAVVFCMREVSGVVSGSFAARGSWPARATFYGGRRPATVGEEGCGGWEKKHRLFG